MKKIKLTNRIRYPNGTRCKKLCVICGKLMILIMSKKDRKKTCSPECFKVLRTQRPTGVDNPQHKPVKVIEIKNGVVTFRFNGSSKLTGKVDVADWDKVKRYSWRVHKNHNNRGYGARNNLYGICARFKGEVPHLVLLHRYILGIENENATKSKKQVDHINRNGLDNRRCNLRIVTQSQNNHNHYRGATGKYPNVRWNNCTGKFYVHFKAEKKVIKLGNFNTPKEALDVYNKARLEFVNTGKIPV